MISQKDSFALGRIVMMAKRWLPFILLTAIISSLIVYVVAGNKPTQYRATATLLIGLADQVPNQSAAVTAGQGLARTYARTFYNAQLYQQAVEELNLGVPAGQLQNAVKVFAVRDTQLVEVQGSWTTPEEAVRITNHMAAMFAKHRQDQAVASLKPTQDFVAEQRVNLAQALAAVPRAEYDSPQTISLRNELDNVVQREQSLIVQTFDIRKQIDVVSPASTAETTGIGSRSLASIALLVGGAVALGLCILAELFRPSTLPQETAQQLGLTWVVLLPRLKDTKAPMWRALREYSSSATAQALRLLPGRLSRNGKVAMIAGIGQRTDSASVAASLAAAYVESGRKVLLVDANLDAPRLDTLLGVKTAVGIQQVLHNPALLESALVSTTLPNVTLLSGKRPATADERAHVDAVQFSQLLKQLGDTFDLVIVDLFEPLQQSIGSGIISITDTTLLVAHEREVTEVALQPYSEWVHQKMDGQTPTLIIFNGTPQPAHSGSTSMPAPVLAQQN